MRGIGHICTTCILETRTYVLVMRSLGNQAFLIVGYLPVRGVKRHMIIGVKGVCRTYELYPRLIEKTFGRKGGSLFPSEEHRRGWSREHTNPLMRESRGRTRHTLGREHETPRIVQRRDEYEGERERGQSRPSGEDIEGPGGRNPYTARLQSSGNRPGCPPTWAVMSPFPIILISMGRRRRLAQLGDGCPSLSV